MFNFFVVPSRVTKEKVLQIKTMCYDVSTIIKLVKRTFPQISGCRRGHNNIVSCDARVSRKNLNPMLHNIRSPRFYVTDYNTYHYFTYHVMYLY